MVSGHEGGFPDQFALQGFEEGLDHGVVIAVSLSGHGYDDTFLLESILIVCRTILASAVGVVD